jgi:deoxyribodipyrimidine photo-lyase
MSAHEQLKTFLQATADSYESSRDRPSIRGTSRLSPYLHFGQIGPRTIWHECRRLQSRNKLQESSGIDTFLKEIGWREFAYHLMYHFPQTIDEPLRPEFTSFPWRDDKSALRAWQRGMTGFPIVDAGMRELWATGWMHNRVRMIAASFLVKDLLISWKEGAAWFWDTLVDADLANNTLGWQWTAGCGADAAPYFRIFNPILQSQKFDPAGEYLKRWLPELKRLPEKWIHAPWTAPSEILCTAGVSLGENYPYPIVDHAEARDRALAALKTMKNRSGQ